MMEKKEKIDWKIVCTGIAALTALEIYALYQGINGWLLAGVMMVIGLAIGITIPSDIVKILLKGGR